MDTDNKDSSNRIHSMDAKLKLQTELTDFQ